MDWLKHYLIKRKPTWISSHKYERLHSPVQNFMKSITGTCMYDNTLKCSLSTVTSWWCTWETCFPTDRTWRSSWWVQPSTPSCSPSTSMAAPSLISLVHIFSHPLCLLLDRIEIIFNFSIVWIMENLQNV